VSIAGGYAILDNHNFLSDGRSGRLELAGGVVDARLVLGGAFIAFAIR
jgi:hypothetical protein